MLNQFGNPDNIKAHYETTGPEVYRGTQKKITHFVSSMGTTGTAVGVGMFLKQRNSDIKIIGVRPAEGSRIAGIRRWAPEYMPTIYNDKFISYLDEGTEEEAN